MEMLWRKTTINFWFNFCQSLRNMLIQTSYRTGRSRFNISISKDMWGRFVWKDGLATRVL